MTAVDRVVGIVGIVLVMAVDSVRSPAGDQERLTGAENLKAVVQRSLTVGGT